jgi:hypothetical protein
LATTCVRASTAPLVAVYTAVVGRVTWLVVEPMLMTLPGVRTEEFRCFLSRQDESEYVGIELPVELFLGNFGERRKLVDPGVVHQHTSNLPKAFVVSAKMRFTLEALATSRWTATALPPFSAIDSHLIDVAGP